MGVEKLKETLAPNMSRKDELELESATGLFFRKDNHDAEDAHSPFGIDNLAGGLSTRTQDTSIKRRVSTIFVIPPPPLLSSTARISEST